MRGDGKLGLCEVRERKKCGNLKHFEGSIYQPCCWSAYGGNEKKEIKDGSFVSVLMGLGPWCYHFLRGGKDGVG